MTDEPVRYFRLADRFRVSRTVFGNCYRWRPPRLALLPLDPSPRTSVHADQRRTVRLVSCRCLHSCPFVRYNTPGYVRLVARYARRGAPRCDVIKTFRSAAAHIDRSPTSHMRSGDFKRKWTIGVRRWFCYICFN